MLLFSEIMLVRLLDKTNVNEVLTVATWLYMSWHYEYQLDGINSVNELKDYMVRSKSPILVGCHSKKEKGNSYSIS